MPWRRHVWTFLLAAMSPLAYPQAIVERHWVYVDGAAQGYGAALWGMASEERPGGGTAGGKHLWLNSDWQAKPWAGVAFRAENGGGFELSEGWIESGFIRFLFNTTVGRYGQPAGNAGLQVKPEIAGIGYQAVGGKFIERGGGRDEDEGSWQEVLVPLTCWDQLKPGIKVRGVSIQCRGQPALAFGYDEIAFVRYNELPDWYTKLRNPYVAQAWAKWPAHEELPDLLKADRHRPRVREAQIVRPAGPSS